MCAVAMAVLDEAATPAFLHQVRERSAQLREGLQALSHRHGLGPVHGRGLLLALELPGEDAAPRVAEAARQRAGDGLLLNPVRPQRLRFVPALNIGEHEVELALQWLDGAIAQAL
jgi:acetylornithine/N-succinyldiaminopimelate aminotransferase